MDLCTEDRLFRILPYFHSSENLVGGDQVDVIFTDFQNVFDQINHYMLLEKLHRFSLSESLITLLKLYPTKRQFQLGT